VFAVSYLIACGDTAKYVDEQVHSVFVNVFGGITAKYVDEDRMNLFVAQDYIKAIGHNLCVSTATDVQEVCWFYIAMFLTGVSDNVQGGHDQTSTVADDTN